MGVDGVGGPIARRREGHARRWKEIGSFQARRGGCGILWGMLRTVVLVALGLAGVAAARGQTPAAPAPPPTIHNSTQVPAAPVKAGDDRTEKGELPLDSPTYQPATDVTPAGSVVPAASVPGYFAPGTVLQLRLNRPIDSLHQRNGETVRGALSTAVQTAEGKTLGKGTPVLLTIISAAPAGRMASYGVLTLQVFRVAGVGVFSNVLDFDGQEGHKDLPDSAPAKGTEATVKAGALLRFKVLGAGDNPDPTVHGKRP